MRTVCFTYPIGAAIAWASLTGSAPGQTCERVLGGSAEGLTWGDPSGHGPAEATCAAVVDTDGSGPLPAWLIVGGLFDRAGDTGVGNLAAWDGTHWIALGTGTNGKVRGLATLGSELFAGGDFTSAGGAANTALMARWQLGAWGPAIVEAGSVVRTWAPNSRLAGMTNDASRVYVCGAMFPSDFASPASFRVWSTNGGDRSDLTCDESGLLSYDCVTGAVQQVAAQGGDAFAICGSAAASPPSGSFFEYRQTGLAYEYWRTALESSTETFTAVKFSNGGVWVGGTGPDGYPRLRKSQLQVTNPPSYIYPTVSIPTAGPGSVTALSPYGTATAAALGYTTGPAGSIATVVLSVATSGSVALGGEFNGRVNEMIQYGGSLFAVGKFTQVGGRTCHGVARFNGTDWLPLLAQGFDTYPAALANFGSGIWAGGTFTVAGGAPVQYLAQQVGGVWQPAAIPAPNGPVTMLSYYAPNPVSSLNESMIVGGPFSTIGGVAAVRIAQFRYPGGILSIQPMGSGLNAQPWVAMPYLTSVSHQDLIVGGDFTIAGGVGANRVARWTGAAWQAIGTGMDGSVYALANLGGQIVAAGNFTTAGGVSALRVAAWNGAVWSPMGLGFNSTVRTLAVYNGQLYAGGDFTFAGLALVNHFARWNGTSWESPGIGVDATVWSLRPVDTDLLLAGTFVNTTPNPGTLNHVGLFNSGAIRPLGAGIPGSVFSTGQNGADIYFGADAVPNLFRATPASAPSVDVSIVTSPCIEAETTFQAQTTNCAGGQVHWRRNGLQLSDGPTASGGVAIGTGTSRMTVYAGSPDEAGSFDAVIACPCGMATSDVLSVSFSTSPRILVQPLPGTFCIGGSQQLAILADGTAPLTYRWYRNGTPVLTTTDAVAVLSAQSVADSGSYTCEVSNSCGAITSQGVTRTAVPPPSISTQPTNRSTCPGGAAVFSVTAGNAAGAGYRWFRNNIALSDHASSPGAGSVAGAATPTLTLGQVVAADAGYFSCHVTTGCTTATDQALLTVSVGACCRADFNGSGAVTIQDLFDFLSAWFSHDPRADFNAVGGITIQDLFDFLAAWFAHC